MAAKALLIADYLVIFRLGHQRGKLSGKPFHDDFYIYVEEVYKMLNDGS